jgi:uncharacterized protein (TIRG00374 family)
VLKRWRTWLGIGISVAAVAWAAQGVDWGQFQASLATADWRLLAVVFILSPIVNVGIRAVRWRILLSPVASPTLAGCVSATAIGLMANNVLPARIGEFVRAYSLGRRERIPTGTAFGSLFVERMFDGFALVAILLALTWVEPLPDWVDTAIRTAFGVFVGFLSFQLLLATRPEVFLGFARRISRRFAKGRFQEPIDGALVTFVDGFGLLRRPWLAAASFFLALAQWSAITLTTWLGLAVFDLHARVGWSGSYFATCVTAFGVSIPSSPGFIGTFEAFIVEALGVFGIDRSAALGFAVAYHVVSFVSVTALGLGYFVREGWSWRDLEKSEERLEHELEREFRVEIAP